MKELAPGDRVRFKLGADTGGLPMLSVGRVVSLSPDGRRVSVLFKRMKKPRWVRWIDITHTDGAYP